MSSPVVTKEFWWKFRDGITQEVAKARQIMSQAADEIREEGSKIASSGEDWKKVGDKAKEAAQDTSQAVSKAKENAESMKSAAQNAAESIRDQFKKTTEVINGIPKEKVFNLKAKFDDDKLKTFSRKINDVPEQKSIWLKIKDGFSNSLKNAQQDADNTKKSFSNLREVMTGTFLGNAVLNGIYAIGNGLKGLIATGYQYTRQQQTMIASWNTLTGSASKGQEMVDMTNKLAISAQNSTEMVNDLNQKFYAVTNSAGKTKELSQSVLTLQDAFNASDASIENFSTQWAQMVGNGKASAQDMLSIQNVFPKFRQELLKYERDATHNKNLTMQQMNDMMSQGKISSKAMNDVLIGMGHKYQDATKNFTNTLDGMGRIIKTTAPRLLGAMVEPFTKAQNPLYNAISKWVSDPRTLKAFQNAGKGMADAFDGAINAVAALIHPFQGLNQLVGEFVKAIGAGVLHGIAINFHLVGDAIQFVLKLIEVLLSPINALSKHLHGIGGATQPIKGLGTVIGALVGPLVVVRTAALGVNTALMALGGAKSVLEGTASLIGKITNLSKIGEGVKALGALVSGTKEMTVAGAALDVVMSPWFLIPAAIIAIGVGFYEAYKHCKTFRDGVNKAFEWISKSAKSVFNFFKNNWKELLLFIANPIVGGFALAYKNSKSFRSKINSLAKGIKDVFTGKAGWEKDLKKNFSNMQKEYQRYSRNQTRLQEKEQKEQQKRWNNFWSGLTKKTRSAWNDISKHTQNGVENVRESMQSRSKSIEKTWNNTWSTIGRFTQNAWKDIQRASSNGMEDVHGAVSSGLSIINRIWNAGWNTFSNIFRGIWNGIKQAAQDGMNGVISVINAGISGINKVWSFFTGHGTGLKELGKVHFAQGGTVHRHLSVINDGDGPDWKELVQTPDGNLFMSQERNWTGFLPEGTRVYSGAETRQIMNAVGVSHYATGGIVGAQHFADGGIIGEGIDWAKGSLENIGSWLGDKLDAIMDFLDDPLKAVKGLLNKATSGLYKGLGNFAGIAHGVLDKLTQPIADWFKKHLEPILDKLEEANPGGAGVARWRPFIERAAKMEGISLTPTMMRKMLTQINTESKGNPAAIGGTDGLADGRATGLLQFKPGTFRSWIWHGHGNIMNGFDQILAAFNALQHGGEGGWGAFGIPGRGWATGGEITSQQFGWVGDNPEHHEFVLNPYAVSAEPLLDRAFEATAQAQPANSSTGNGNSKLDQMIDLLGKVLVAIESQNTDIYLDGEKVTDDVSKRQGKTWRLRKN